MASPSKALAEANRKSLALHEALTGKGSASSSSLARSYGMSVEHVMAIMKRQGVKDDD